MDSTTTKWIGVDNVIMYVIQHGITPLTWLVSSKYLDLLVWFGVLIIVIVKAVRI
jgi:hypothetical protein